VGWRETIRGPASFRNVPFFVDTAERGGSRRIVLHEFPGRDGLYAEDMGRGPRSFPVEGYVLGDDYLAAKNALIAALEEGGTGELVLPYYGTKRVVANNFRVRESTQDGGIARFAIDFTETEERPSSPTSAPAGKVLVNQKAEKALAELRARLALQRALAAPSSALARLATVIEDASNALAVALAPLDLSTQELAAMKRQLDNVVLDAAALARQPVDAFDAFSGVVASLTTSPAGPVVDALLSAYAFSPSESRPGTTTANRLLEQEGYDLILHTVRTVEVVQAAKLTPTIDFGTYDDASRVRGNVCDALDALLDLADDATYEALGQLRAALVRAVPGEDSDLPRLVRYAPPVSVPSLVLAHQLYGDLAHEADIVNRNRVAHPGFIIGGTELEVLSDA
jgi:prophage DNA circulation protein